MKSYWQGSTKKKISGFLILLIGLFCLSTWGNSALALMAGIILALTLGNPWQEQTKKWAPQLLSYSIIGLGAGMNLITVAEAGVRGFGYTFFGIALTLALGLVLTRWLKSEYESSLLISVGTAICGGSAIAAAAPAIEAKPHSISVSLGTVFFLNALALVLFPFLGRYFAMTQEQFGLWSALAIHDTSSVVGASMQFGSDSLQIATTVKLARALWIVPVTLLLSWWVAHQNRQHIAAETQLGAKVKRIKKPWFILGFLFTAALVTFVPVLKPFGPIVQMIARRGLVLTLFLIGLNLTLDTLRSVGVKPLLLGVLLWIIVSASSLVLILKGVITL